MFRDTTWCLVDTRVHTYQQAHSNKTTIDMLGVVCSVGDGMNVDMFTRQPSPTYDTTRRQLFLKAAVSVVDRQPTELIEYFCS